MSCRPPPPPPQPYKPLDITVAFRHKPTALTSSESHTTVGTLGQQVSYSNLCYTGSDALAAVITVTTTPAKDRLYYSLRVVKAPPAVPLQQPPAPAAAAAAAAEAAPSDAVNPFAAADGVRVADASAAAAAGEPGRR